MKATTPNDRVIPTDYFTAKSIRSAIASELARRIHISDELIAACERRNAAIAEFREAVRKAIDEQRENY